MSQAVSSPPKSAGLEGVVAAKSEVCYIDGVAGRLVFRGYEIADLVENLSFEETAYLLWTGKLPNRQQISDLKQQIVASAKLPKSIEDILRSLPKGTHPMDALRTTISALGCDDADKNNNSPEASERKAIRLTAQFPVIVAAYDRIRNGKDLIAWDPSLSIAANFLYMQSGKKPHDTVVRVMDAALVIHAEHGMNASTLLPA